MFAKDIRDMCSSRRSHGERAEGKCSTEVGSDVGMERTCGENWAMTKHVCLFADGHTASNAPDRF